MQPRKLMVLLAKQWHKRTGLKALAFLIEFGLLSSLLLCRRTRMQPRNGMVLLTKPSCKRTAANRWLCFGLFLLYRRAGMIKPGTMLTTPPRTRTL